MEVRLLQPEKALLPMDVTLLGIIVFLHPNINVFDDCSIIALQLPRESYLAFPLSTTMEVRPLQPEKEPLLMLVTLLGIVMEVRPLQPEKAPTLMLVTLLGIVIEVRELQ